MAETSFYTKPPEVLYHYCSVPTFYNIIKNKSIWLSDISKSNDSEELRWYLRSFKAVLDKAWNLYIEQRQKHGKNDDPEIIRRLHDGILNAAEQEQAFVCPRSRTISGNGEGMRTMAPVLPSGFDLGVLKQRGGYG